MTTVGGSRLVVYVSGVRSLLHRVMLTRAASAAILPPGRPSVLPTEVYRSRHPDRGLEPLTPLTPMDSHLEAQSSRHRAQTAVTPPDNGTNAQMKLGDDEFFASGSVECAVQPCPQRLSADVPLMFPLAPPAAVTVITVTQRSVEDMSRWSSSVEAEREELLQTFIRGASIICSQLQGEGHWADFIEPSSGLPFFGPYTNLPLFETDERFSLLGFSVEDLGCCRVLRHSRWGTHAFVGTIFTSAPPTGSRVMDSLQGREVAPPPRTSASESLMEMC